MEKILVTGASGFIGSHIVEEALRRGFDVWAAVRKSSSREYLKDERIHFVELNLSSQQQLEQQLGNVQFDYVVHAAGATKCLHVEDFYRINTEGTKNLVRALLAVGMPLKRFVFISSLSIMGAIHEQLPYQEIQDTDTPQPNTAYGRSKLEAERFLDSLSPKLGDDRGMNKDSSDPQPPNLRGLNYVILRPTGVYGPREKDYFLQIQSIGNHMDFAVGFQRQDITFIYVTDVVQAVFLAMEKGETGHKYMLSDGEVYQSATFSDYVHEELGRPWWIRVTAPIWLLRIITFCGEYWGRWTKRMTALNNDKFNILRQRNWRCNMEPARRELGFEPKVKLREGVRRSIAWYKENGWIK